MYLICPVGIVGWTKDKVIFEVSSLSSRHLSKTHQQRRWHGIFPVDQSQCCCSDYMSFDVTGSDTSND